LCEAAIRDLVEKQNIGFPGRCGFVHLANHDPETASNLDAALCDVRR
jgi:hypothetical protein